MKPINILLVVNDGPLQHGLVQVAADLCHLLQANLGLLCLVDPGDISPVSSFYDDVMEEFQARGGRYLKRYTAQLPELAGAPFLRISRYPDRSIATVAKLFNADYVVLGRTLTAFSDQLTNEELVQKLAKLSSVRVVMLPLADSQPMPLTYLVHDN